VTHALRLSLACLPLVACGCGTPIFFALTTHENVLPGNRLVDVKVTTRESVEGEYSEIGYVFVGGDSVASSIENLKRKAAELGGTAVIRLQTTVVRTNLVILFVPIPSDRYYAQGVVVREEYLRGETLP
jgi:hypothetical protein